MRHLAIGLTVTLVLSASLGLIGEGIALADEAAPQISTLVSSSASASPGASSTLGRGTLALEVGVDGTIYMADSANHVVRRVHSDGSSRVIAGTGTAGYNGDNRLATEAQLNSPAGLAVAPSGVVYIADSGNHRLRAIRTDGMITTLAGAGTPGYAGDGGPARASLLSTPSDVTLDGGGMAYVADTGNDRLRALGPDGTITTVTAELSEPHEVAVASDGTIYVTDTGNHRLLAVGTDGTVTTIAGTGIPGYTGDGGAATEAQLMLPSHLAVGADGAIFLADGRGHRIRHIGNDGQIHTLAGTGVAGYSGDGGPAAQAQLNLPGDVATDPAGVLYVADTGNQVIRVISPVVPEAATTTTESTTTSTTEASTTTVTEATSTTAAPPPPTTADLVAMAAPDPTQPPPAELPPPDTIDELSAQPIASVTADVDKRGMRTSAERNHRQLAALALGLISLGTLVLALRRTPRVVPSSNQD